MEYPYIAKHKIAEIYVWFTEPEHCIILKSDNSNYKVYHIDKKANEHNFIKIKEKLIIDERIKIENI